MTTPHCGLPSCGLVQDELVDCPCDNFGIVRLCNETLRLRKSDIRAPPVSGRHDYSDGWPTVSDKLCELQPIHRSRHVDVSENDADLAVIDQAQDRFIRIGSLDNIEPGIAQVFCDGPTDQWFVLHH